jgi:hypothetical protein
MAAPVGRSDPAVSDRSAAGAGAGIVVPWPILFRHRLHR